MSPPRFHLVQPPLRRLSRAAEREKKRDMDDRMGDREEAKHEEETPSWASTRRDTRVEVCLIMIEASYLT